MIEKRRFKSEDGTDFPEWKKVRIGDVFTVTRGKVLATSLTKQESDESYIYPVYSSQTKMNGLMGFYDEFLFSDAITWTTDGANAGEVKFRKGKFYCTNVCGVLLSDKYANTAVSIAINRVTHKYVSYVGNPKLMNGVMSEITLLLPSSTSEMKRISVLFEKIEDKINLLTKKKEALETYKKGLMQKIFSQELRFKREDGTDYPEWKEVLYSEFLKERDSKHPQSDEFPLCSFVAYKGVVPKGERYNREFLVSDKKGKKYKRTVKGDFIYSSNNLETGSIGLNTYGDGCISPVYSIFSIDKSCDINFITNYLVTKANLHKMIRFRQGVMYGQWRIHETDFLKIKVALPSNEEQKHIGEALQSLNSGIKELERLISATSKFKKGLLQQMFV